MDEKILLKSNRYDIKKFRKISLLIGISLAILWILSGTLFAFIKNYDDIVNEELEYYDEQYNIYLEHVKRYGASDYYHYNWCWTCELIREYPTKSSYIIDGFFFQPFLMTKANYFIILGIIIFVFIIIPLIMYFALRSYRLIITDKRVYGTAAFGKRVDLPLDSISAISQISFLKGVCVSTSSGKIKFIVLKNFAEIYGVLSQLLLTRQENKTTNSQQNDILNIPDLLLKYKKLLDDGLINQEEYDKKKTELLNK